MSQRCWGAASRWDGRVTLIGGERQNGPPASSRPKTGGARLNMTRSVLGALSRRKPRPRNARPFLEKGLVKGLGRTFRSGSRPDAEAFFFSFVRGHSLPPEARREGLSPHASGPTTVLVGPSSRLRSGWAASGVGVAPGLGDPFAGAELGFRGHLVQTLGHPAGGGPSQRVGSGSRPPWPGAGAAVSRRPPRRTARNRGRGDRLGQPLTAPVSGTPSRSAEIGLRAPSPGAGRRPLWLGPRGEAPGCAGRALLPRTPFVHGPPACGGLDDPRRAVQVLRRGPPRPPRASDRPREPPGLAGSVAVAHAEVAQSP